MNISFNRPRRLYVLAAIILVTNALRVEATTLNYTAQSRQVDVAAGVQGGGGSLSDLDVSPNFAPWTGFAEVAYSDVNGSAAASSAQQSILNPTGISVSGTMVASADNFRFGFARSFFSTSFILDSPVPYVSTLTGLNPNQFSFQVAGGTLYFPANSSGILPAGGYTIGMQFQILASPPGSASYASGGFDYNLSILPEPPSWALGVFVSLCWWLVLCHTRILG